MRKIYLALLTVALAATHTISAQSYEGKTEYLKKDEPALVIEFPYPPDVVEKALTNKMEKMGHKPKESKGFLVYKSITLPDISPESRDYIIKVERKSRKEKDESVVYMIMNSGTENTLTRSLDESNMKAKTFLNSLVPDAEAYNLEQEILAQEGEVKKAEKKYAGQQDDESSLEKKIAKLEKDLEENRADQEKQRQEIAKQKQILDAMRAKRKI